MYYALKGTLQNPSSVIVVGLLNQNGLQKNVGCTVKLEQH